MLRVTFQTCHECQYLATRTTGRDELLRQSWLAIGERSGLVENRSPTPGDLLKHDRAIDNNRSAGAEGNRADDCNGNGEKQGARCGNDQHGKKTDRFATDHPS